MVSINLISERPIKMELPAVTKEQKDRFVNMAKASVLKVKKIHNMEKPNQKMTQKEQEQTYFLMYAATAGPEALSQSIAMKKSNGEKFRAPVSQIINKKINGIKESTRDRLSNWQVNFTSNLQDRVPDVSLSKQREYGKTVSMNRVKESESNFSLEDAEFDLD